MRATERAGGREREADTALERDVEYERAARDLRGGTGRAAAVQRHADPVRTIRRQGHGQGE